MTARKPTRKRSPRPARTPETIPCTVHVQRGGVAVTVEHVMLADADAVACFVLGQLQQHRERFPELDLPQHVEHFGGYNPVPVTDDDTWARKKPLRVGF